MSLIKRDFPMLNGLSDFFEEDWMPSVFQNGWSPAVNVVDNEKNYEIEVVAPGLKKEDFNVSVENRVLIISGYHEEKEEEKEKNYTRREFSSRSFNKSFTLPTNVNDEKLEAKYKDGVLKLTIEKIEKEKPSKLEVTVH